MKLKLFPTKKFIFQSSCSREEIIGALRDNVTDPASFTITFLSQYADRKAGKDKYFEGTVNDDDFFINHRSYNYSSTSSGFISFMPQITGTVLENKRGAEIRVAFKNYTPPIILLFFFVPIFIVATIFFTPSMKYFSFFVVISIFFIHFIYYRYRIEEDCRQLKMIFKANG